MTPGSGATILNTWFNVEDNPYASYFHIQWRPLVDVVARFSRVRYVLEILEVYDSEAGKPGIEYKARHIHVKTREEVEEFIHELDKGGDFSALAKEKSADTSAMEGGGDIRWFSPPNRWFIRSPTPSPR